MASLGVPPLLILLPGTDGTGVFYKRLCDHLGKLETRILSYPQTGPQTYERLGALLLSCLPHDRPYVLVAESFAGPLAIWLASHTSHKPLGLVLAASFAAAPFGWMGRLISSLVPFVPVLPISAWAINYLMFNGKDPLQAAEVKSVVSSLDRNTIKARLRVALTCDMRGWLGLVNAPVLVLKPAQDRLLPAWLDNHLGALADTTTISLKYPHMVFQSDDEGLAARHVRTFVEGQFGKTRGS